MKLKKIIAAPVSLGLTIASFPLLSSPAYAKTVKVSVPKAVVSTAFNAALSSTKIHLDNYGKKQGRTSWHQDSSYILFPNGAKQSFPIPEYPFKVTRYRQLKYYIDDMNTSSIKSTINGSRIKTTLYFESQGEEVKAKCIRRRFKKWNECSLKMERDIHLNNSVISMSLTPIAYKGSISYANSAVDFKTDLRIASKLCQSFKGICKNIEGRIKNELTNNIETRLAKGLNNSNVRAKVASSVKKSLKSNLGKYNNWKIVSIKSKGNKYILKLSK
ncbi:MAG: hypothetical protein KI793_20465 [Rivularia sp. (in: Bacteria)]|nr:hypothetical protein [Rivularia sp. MS3]